MKTILTSSLILAILAGCHQPVAKQNSATPVAATGDDYLQRINGLPGKQRDAAFLRAIVDAGFACQSVTSSQTHTDVQGYPAWLAHCTDGRDWVIVLEKNGIVQVVTPAQLRGAPSPTPVGAAGRETRR